MDPFREDFDAEHLLRNLQCPDDVQPSASFADFERHIVADHPRLHRALLAIERDGDEAFRASGSTLRPKVSGGVSEKAGPSGLSSKKDECGSSAKQTQSSTKMSTRERTRRLAKVCAAGKQPISVRATKVKRKRVKQVSAPKGSGKGAKVFACAQGTSLFACLERWATDGDRVYVKLRADAALRITQEPNRLLQGVIVAFDKHWNLVMRDVDEVYTPAVRLRKVQASARAMPPSALYSARQWDPNHYVMERHLRCSLITGSSIVCVYKPNT